MLKTMTVARHYASFQPGVSRPMAVTPDSLVRVVLYACCTAPEVRPRALRRYAGDPHRRLLTGTWSRSRRGVPDYTVRRARDAPLATVTAWWPSAFSVS
jgi:hypothetical protein